MRKHSFFAGRPVVAEYCRRLTTVSLLGMVHGLEADSRTCDAAIEPTLADPARHELVRAMARGIGGDASSAVGLMDALAIDDPENDRIKVTLALAMLVAGAPQWKPVIERVLALSTDIPARVAATTVMAQAAHLSPRSMQ